MLGILGGLASSLLGSGGGGLLSTIGNIGKKLIFPIGSKLLQAGKSAIQGLLGNAGSMAKEGLKKVSEYVVDKGQQLLDRGMQSVRNYIPEDPQMEVEEEETPPESRRIVKAKNKKNKRRRIQEEPETIIPPRKQIEMEEENEPTQTVSKSRGFKRDYEQD